jgi:FAD/FMN-containing dehydrogenase
VTTFDSFASQTGRYFSNTKQIFMSSSATLVQDRKTALRTTEKAFQDLKSTIRGPIIQKGEPFYEVERQVYNGMIDRRPEAIIKCRDVADVIACVNFANAENVITSVRAGGHNAGGLGMCDDGLVIDLSLMRGIRVDQAANTVRAEGGCLLGDIDHATQPFGKAVPTGILSTTGIAGLTLGGGIGHLSRAYGLSIDSLLEVDVVLANGKLVTANEKENADLFWAIRGGGGNFGIATSFLFRLHDTSNVYGGPMLWHMTEAEHIMKFYRDYISTAPNTAYCYFAFLTVPPVPIFPAELHLKKMCGLVWCNVGDQEVAVKSVNDFRNFRKPALDYVGSIPFPALQSMFDGLYPKGLQWYWKADFVKELSDEAIKVNLKYGEKLPTTHSTMHLYPISGVCHSATNTDTAFSYRDANWAQVIVGVDPDPGNSEKLSTWAKEYWEAIHPFSAGGAYVNFMMDEGQERVKASYRDNYERLRRIKSKYDPTNFFRINQNILPS